MAVDPRNLQRVIDVAKLRRDKAAGELSQARSQLAAGQSQMAQLQDYIDQGQAQWVQRASQGVSVALMQHQRQFMEKIQSAIDFQNNVLTQRQTRVEGATAHLQAAEVALAQISKIQHMSQAAQALRAAKAEQKRNDEMAMSMHAFQRRQAHHEAFP
jgi:flagellar protein FliJ